MSFSYTRCEDFIDQATALFASHTAGDPHGGHQNDSDPSPQEIMNLIEECELTLRDFIELDERPGRFDSRYHHNQWHRLLRIARNDPTNDLFEVLK